MEHVIEPYLDITSPIYIDDSVSKVVDHVILPSDTNSINTQNKIVFRNTDLSSFDRISKSYIHMTGTVQSTAAAYTNDNTAVFVNNGPVFLFERATLVLGVGSKVEDVSEPGISSLVTGLISYDSPREEFYFIADNDSDLDSDGYKARKAIIVNKKLGTFDVTIPLSHIFGFCRTYDKVVTGTIKTLELVRRNDNFALIHGASPIPAGKVVLNTIEWVVPVVVPSPRSRVQLYKTIERGTNIEMPFVCTHVNQIPVPTGSTLFKSRCEDHGGMDRVQYAIVVFQTKRTNNQTVNNAIFDNVGVRKMEIILGGQRFPDTTVNIDFSTGGYAQVYKTLRDFREFFTESKEMLVKYNHFESLYPMFAFDLTKQEEQHNNRLQSMELNVEFSSSPPAETICYVLTFSTKIVNYEINGDRLSIV